MALTEKQAYDAMILFLDAWWQEGGKKSDDIAGLLGDMHPGLWADRSPNDPAMWSSWLDAIERATDPAKRPGSLDTGAISKTAGD